MPVPYAKRNKEKNRVYQLCYRRNIRSSILKVLGGKCRRCGFKDPRALQIDHVNGGGRKETKIRQAATQYYHEVKKSFKKKENKYQLLCANCNWIKRAERQEGFKTKVKSI